MAKGIINLQKASGGIVKISPVDGIGVTEVTVPESGNLVSVGTTVTDNAIARYDGTTGKLQDSGVIIDDAGNVGIGVTPSAWQSGITALNLGNAFIHYGGGTNFVMGVNAYANVGYKYKTSGYATNYTQQDGTHQWFTAPSGTAGNSISWTQAMSLDNNGILTLSPNNISGIQDGLVLYDAGSGNSEGLRIKWTSSSATNIASIYGSSGNGLFFQVGGADKMLLDNNGNFNVLGSISCGQNGVTYGAAGSSSLIAYGGDGTSYTQVVGRNTSGSSVVFYSVVAGVNKSAILSNGNFQSATNSYGSTSDAKLKENVQDASPKLDKLMQVQVRTFNYIGQEDKQIGVVAQEIEKIFPTIVYETKDTKQVEVTKTRIIPAVEEVLNEDGSVLVEAKPEDIEEYTEIETQETGETTKNVKYSVIYMMMLKAMQEQQEIINDLKARISILENK